jgi:hypothetical protein
MKRPSLDTVPGRRAFGMRVALGLLLVSLAWRSTATARDNLGLYAGWGAFRDPFAPRCYAIAMAEPGAQQRDYQPFAAIGTWPRRGKRNQIHFRLSRAVTGNSPIVLGIGTSRFALIGGGGDAWAANDRDNAAIVAAMRSAPRMVVSARDTRGRRFANAWPLAGAASAMDAAAIGCARTD